MDTSIKAYQNLADAIILQAVKDYKMALEMKKCTLKRRTIRDCERFFKSQWFCILNDADGEKIMERIRKEVLNESKSDTTNS